MYIARDCLGRHVGQVWKSRLQASQRFSKPGDTKPSYGVAVTSAGSRCPRVASTYQVDVLRALLERRLDCFAHLEMSSSEVGVSQGEQVVHWIERTLGASGAVAWLICCTASAIMSRLGANKLFRSRGGELRLRKPSSGER